MNKRLFIFVFGLMSISIIGIILVQVYWINNAIAIEKQKFDNHVTQALNNTIQKLQKQNDFVFVSQQLQVIKTDSILKNEKLTFQNSSKSVSFSFDDTSMNAFVFLMDNIKDSNVVWHNSSQMILDDTSSMQYIVKTTENDKNPQIIHEEIEIKSYTNSKNQKKIIQKKINRLNNVINQMVIEYSFGDNPLEKRINKKFLQQSLEKEFANVNIHLNYQFGIFENETLKETLSSKGFQPAKDQSTYKISIFTDDVIHQTNNRLEIYFPEKNNHIYSSLALMMGASLLFTIGILVTFAVTIFVILKQKKIAEIKTDFINNMTHEFKTPIATISLAVDSINNPKIIENTEKIKHFTKIIKEENKRMNAQVESVLQMSLLEKKDFELQLNIHDIHPIIQQAIQTISIQVENKNGKISSHFEAKKSKCNIDTVHFQNIILNLLDNSNKYSDTEPIIEVSTKNKDKFTIIEIKDHGMGMTQEDQSKIFDKFYRVSTGNIHNIKGFGLGLSYVKAIVNAFDGKITVSSELKKGTIFTISLPNSSN